ncbi:hypothetical protein GALMADRAFT_82296 [Galerina marginata CBS 339.88]|uniref:Uncharacterized protein n=1 Tax=Galerina marginata (strain CBS 339.88) TaxID=685588 RepID=A0A067SE95_GALM3|nr:hypothetical protein GALMADRAFT_82296 [Galerina marginata CBS 339.88]
MYNDQGTPLLQRIGPDLIRDDQGKVPNIANLGHDWTDWIALNCDIDKVPTEARIFKNFEDRKWAIEPITATGRYLEQDWAVEPDWYRHNHHWRAFIPVNDGTLSDVPWYLIVDQAMPLHDVGSNPPGPNQRFFANRDSARRYQNTYQSVRSLVEEVWTTILQSSPCGLPADVNPFILDGAFRSETLLQRASADVKRSILDHVGWLRWLRAVLPEVSGKMPSRMASRFETTCDMRLPSRGIILDLTRDWTEVNVSLLLTYKVPIYYMWGLEERMEERLSKLNPHLIALAPQDDRVVFTDEERDEAWEQAASNSTRFDNYFQPRYPSTPISHESYESDAVFYVIDFVGWKRRNLHPRADPDLYSAAFDFQTTTESNQTTVTFWRWRKKTSSFALRSPTTEEDDNILYSDSERTIRELYKFEYAPTKELKYDLETGLPSEDDDDTDSVDAARGPSRTNITGEYRGHMGDDSESPPSESDVEMSTIPLDSLSTPYLLSRLRSSSADESPYVTKDDSIANITSWRNVARRIVEAEGEPSQPVVIANSRSISPRPALSGHIIPRQRPAALFNHHLREIGSRLTYQTSLFTLAEPERWNPLLFEHGVLMLPDPRVEVRMRYFANCVYEARFLSALLRIAIEHRWSFRIGIPSTLFSRFAPRNVPQLERIRASTLYDPDFTEAPFTFINLVSFVALYLGKIMEILQRPHAPTFIAMGGACSWIAHYWGGNILIDLLMWGPSIQTTLYGAGMNDVRYEHPFHVHWDRVSAQEISFLFGHIPHPTDSRQDRWLFPPPHILEEFCDHWTGEWNEGLESIFLYIARGVKASPPEIEPKSRGSWKTFLRTYNRGPLAPSYILSTNDVTDIFKGIEQVNLPRTWDHTRLSNIFLPERAD